MFVCVYVSAVMYESKGLVSGLRGLEVTFSPHDPSDAGSIPAEVIEFFRTEKFGNTVLRKGL
jgi:hypothetical protein